MTARNILMSAAGASGQATYVEDVFSTYLYTGNGSTQTITNGIDLAGKGGLVWRKQRTANSWTAWTHHSLSDTARGVNAAISTSTTSAESIGGDSFVTAFNTNGFSIGPDSSGYGTNKSTEAYVSWTFRKQPKFFDVVTYTGNDTAGRNISHNLGSVPGCIIVKNLTNGSANWYVYHQSLGNATRIFLNLTDASSASTNWNNTTPTSTVFTVGNGVGVNASGNDYVAYLFAHDAGGFGLTGTDNVISCGSFTTDVITNATVNLGYEPQWVMMKDVNVNDGLGWFMFDNMRGMPGTGTNSIAARLLANSSAAENPNTGDIKVTATGFNASLNASRTYIYIAIRRPMKVPTDATKVFAPVIYTGNENARTISAGFPVDLFINQSRVYADHQTADRLRGPVTLQTQSTTAENTSFYSNYLGFDSQTGIRYKDGMAFSAFNETGINYVQWAFRRARSFFDVVCYTGNGPGTQTVYHNLGVAPELVINRSRAANGWTVFQGNTTSLTGFLRLNDTYAQSGDTLTVSSTSFTADSTIGFGMNASGVNYVTYLFATCPGVSKVGSYTGTGTTQQINCGFAAGARFVMIKRRDSTGDWYIWDTARGIVSGNDPYLFINSTSSEDTSTDYIDPYSAGFEISSTAPAAINASGGTFIYLAIA